MRRYIKVILYEDDPHKVLYEDESEAIDVSYVNDRAKNMGYLASKALDKVLHEECEKDGCEFEEGVCINCGDLDEREPEDREVEDD